MEFNFKVCKINITIIYHKLIDNIMTLSLTTFSIITLSRRGFYVTLSKVKVSINDSQHK
jgi:hypothetical protein